MFIITFISTDPSVTASDAVDSCEDELVYMHLNCDAETR